MPRPETCVTARAVELAARRPQTTQALLAVKGMGKMKYEKYGAQLLEILAS